ncbi:MAG: PspA/IM30 family protein [Thermoguttaceae bacterium]
MGTHRNPPKKRQGRSIAGIEKAIAELTDRVAALKARLEQLGAELEKVRQAAQRWRQRAAKARQQGETELARKAAARNEAHNCTAATLQKTIEQARQEHARLAGRLEVLRTQLIRLKPLRPASTGAAEKAGR